MPKRGSLLGCANKLMSLDERALLLHPDSQQAGEPGIQGESPEAGSFVESELHCHADKLVVSE